MSQENLLILPKTIVKLSDNQYNMIILMDEMDFCFVQKI